MAGRPRRKEKQNEAPRPKGVRKKNPIIPKPEIIPSAEKFRYTSNVKYTDEVAEYICEELADGRLLNDICQDEFLVHHGINSKTVRSWAWRNSFDFQAKYWAARIIGVEAMSEEILRIADDSSEDTEIRISEKGIKYEVVNHDHINRARLRIETRKFLLAKIVANIYGDKSLNKLGQTFEETTPAEINAPRIENDRMKDITERFSKQLKIVEATVTDPNVGKGIINAKTGAGMGPSGSDTKH